MTVLGSMATGISGLTATGQGLAIIGDNIANAGTFGYKASRGQFHDLIAKNLRGILGGNQIGRGVTLAGVTGVFSQGTVNATERDTDLAITGDGFFVVEAQDGHSYSRDGSFMFDAKGRLTDIDGRVVQGFQANGKGDITSKIGAIDINQQTIPAFSTKNMKFEINLDARVPIKEFDPLRPEQTAEFGTGVQIYDSIGNAHATTMYFHRIADNTWKWHIMGDGKEVVGGKVDEQKEIAAGTLTFNKEGQLFDEKTDVSNITFVNGAEPNQKIEFDFGDSIQKDKGTGQKGSTQYGATSTMYQYSQDGASAGYLTGVAISESGVLTGSYSNGTTRSLAQLAIARFNSNEGLYKMGTNRFREAIKSGPPVVGKPGEGGRGTIRSKSIEFSNVDLAEEFVRMIQTQRNFQANAKTLTTADEMLQDIINLKR